MAYKVQKSIQEINERIKSGKVVVVNAEEMIDIVEKQGAVEAARKVDVVTEKSIHWYIRDRILKEAREI